MNIKKNLTKVNFLADLHHSQPLSLTLSL